MDGMVLGMMPEEFIFAFFMLGIAGWVCETINESITRRRFVNKGFFKGPIIPCQGIGGIGVYLIASFFKSYPPLVFLTGVLVCTAVEYGTAIFLEKCFRVKCWDYRTYPHTKWCHYQGRVALTISFFFGIATLFVVYGYWDFIMSLVGYAEKHILLIDGILTAFFCIDVLYSCTKLLRYKKEGIPLKGWAVFSNSKD
jgi:uncharacterized membrane protein